ncbi:helix-turn-helix domain-containing protein [Nannocystis bainbridge]|uniref:Helix-turn-helix domain-containing protein n=1 Tax=Nannocystis bainbridge TaxID=2995303 RepID=A0ABT5ECF3_9BACT|nr:helix-turn-helix domain-containing protein [Nannocystis bainbridge]MDC0722461.1 helix-turn-helix domain-containing protein [Nannocystis bainbridge]
MASAPREDFDLDAVERRLCVEALELAGNIVDAAWRLGITRQAMKRRIKKHRIAWPRPAARTPRVDDEVGSAFLLAS